MEHKFLLTYEYQDENGKTVFAYDWFETEEDMHDFVEGNRKVKVVEGLEIVGCREIY
jgi:hypothetical protein